jgi:outer membrane protein TolC
MKKIVFITLLCFSKTVFAQDVLSYQDCLNLALKNNLQLKSALNSEKIAQYQYTASYGKLLPNFSGSLDNRNSWGREIDPQTNLFVNTDIKNYIGFVNANYNLFAGFSALNNIRYTKQEFKINQENIKRVENIISITLAEKFITILYLEEIIAANKEQIKSSENQLELALLKFNSGTIPESEVFKIKSQKATEELNLLTNQNRLTDNMVNIKILMNIPLEKEIVLIKPIMKLDSNITIDQNPFDIINKAIEINPKYKISLLREKKAKAALAIARATRYPLLTMRAQYGANYTNTDEVFGFKDQLRNNEINILRLNLIIPVFSQMDNYSKSKTSKMLYKQSKVDTQIAKNELSQEVMKAITDTKTSMKKNEASSIAFEFSEKSFQADALKFELGKININELNNTKINYINSQAQLIQSKYELLYNNALIKFYLGEEFSL